MSTTGKAVPRLAGSGALGSSAHGGRTGIAASEIALRALYVLTFGAVLLLVLVPISALLYGSFRTTAPGQAGGEWTLRNYANLASEGVVNTIWTTLWIGLLSAAFCIVIGTALALIVHRTDFRWPRTMTTLIGLAFYFPSFIVAMAWIIMGSPGGIVNAVLRDMLGLDWLEVDIYSGLGIVFVTVLHQVPFVYLTVRGPIIHMDATYEEAARASGARPATVMRKVTLPLLGYSLASSFILVFVLAIEQFAVPALIGIPGQVSVLATQLYLLVRFTPVDYGLAATVGLALSAITGAAIWAQRRITKAGRLTTVTGKAGRVAAIPLGRWRWAANLFCFGFITLALLLPMVILLYTSVLRWFTANPFAGIYTWRNYVFMWESSSTWDSFWNTLLVSGIGAALGVVLGLSCSYFTLRVRPGGHKLLDFVGVLPFGVPGIVIGLGLLWAYAFLPLPLYGTLAVIIIAFVTRFLPYATETIGGQMVQIDRSLEEAAWVAGANRLSAARRIMLPLVAPSVQGAYFLLFMAFFREISAAILLYAADTKVISVSIWAFFEQANWGQASALSVAATLVIFLVLLVIGWLVPAGRRF
ncbi:ABC transporter permease [Falsiroseomonas sp. CW058]|uniref:ABC transporter permease n=1 Tax=Falsiroseomonas sp. CW058 TaxID=3388664 RepID=UPI003D31315C